MNWSMRVALLAAWDCWGALPLAGAPRAARKAQNQAGLGHYR